MYGSIFLVSCLSFRRSFFRIINCFKSHHLVVMTMIVLVVLGNTKFACFFHNAVFAHIVLLFTITILDKSRHIKTRSSNVRVFIT